MCNVSASFVKNEEGEIKACGNDTEVGMLNYFRDTVKWDPEAKQERIKADRNNELVVFETPFNSERKRMQTAWLKPDDKSVRLFVKGAPDKMMPQCAEFLGKNGEWQKLTD